MALSIKAALMSKAGAEVDLVDASLDEPRADEIVVQIKAVGICHTDVHALKGGFSTFTPPAVLGHEGAGIVTATGRDVTKVVPGDRVGLTFRHCGECRNCAAHHPAYCLHMPGLNYICRRPDGSRAISVEGEAVGSNFFGQSSFATHALTYEANVVRLDDDVPFALAAPMGCGFQTGAGSVLNSLRCRPGSSFLVIGGGAVGLSAIMAARYAGCGMIALIEPLPQRRALALELGAAFAFEPGALDLRTFIDTHTPGGFDNVLDTTGRVDMLQAAVDLLGPGASLGCVGIPPAGTSVPGDLKKLLTYGHGIFGIIEGDSHPDTFIPQMIDLWRDGKMPFDRLIKTYPFAQINEAIRAHSAGECVKAVLTLD